MTTFHTLPTITNLVNDTRKNGFPTPVFGQFQQVDNVNFLDAHITSPAGKPLTQKEKQQKSNQFCFMGIHHEQYVIGVAVVNLKTVSNCFVYVYDKTSNAMIESSKLSPLGAGTHMPTTPNAGKIQFQQGLSRVIMDFEPSDEILLEVKLAKVNLQARITPSTQPMCLCTRTGYTGWVYMQKQTALACAGKMTVKLSTGKTKTSKSKVIFTHANCRAGIDWTLGYMTRETFWNWASINANLPNGNTLGLNLVCGVNDTSYTENAVWLNDTLYNLPLIIFDYDVTDLMKPWHIYSNAQLPSDRKLDLTFTPHGRRDDHTDVKLMASHFSQLIGTYSGMIELPHETIELNNVWGLTEEHYAKW